MSKAPSPATQLKHLKREFRIASDALIRFRRQVEEYRGRAMLGEQRCAEAEQRCAEWEKRFDALLAFKPEKDAA